VYRYDDLPAKVFAQSTTLDFERNVQTVVKYFQEDKRTKNQPVGLLGHSEGGSIAFMAAGNNSTIDFIISLAGTSEKLSNALLYQNEKLFLRKENGFSDIEITEVLELHKKIHQLIEKAKKPKDAIANFEKTVAEYSKNWSYEQKIKYGFSAKDLIGWAQLIKSPWFFNILKLDFVKYIKKIKCPVYAMIGEKDLQIYYKTNLEVIAQNLPKKTPSKVVSFPNVNHILQPCETGLLDEYGIIEETISQKVLDDILLWLDEVNK
jgi:pimeloyl-ACP methyl ester carboxylesterase